MVRLLLGGGAGAERRRHVNGTMENTVYRYGRAFLCITVLTTALFLFSLVLLVSPRVRATALLFGSTLRNGLSAILLANCLLRLYGSLSRRIELRETEMKCSWLRLSRRVRSYSTDLRYAEVYLVKSKKVLGLFEYLYLYRYSADRPFVVSPWYSERKRLFAEICSRVTAANPKAVILTRFCQSPTE